MFHIFRGDQLFFCSFLSPGPPSTGSDLASVSGKLPKPSGEEAFRIVNETAVGVFLGRKMKNVAVEDWQPLESFPKYQGIDLTLYWTLCITQAAFYSKGCCDHCAFQAVSEILCKSQSENVHWWFCKICRGILFEMSFTLEPLRSEVYWVVSWITSFVLTIKCCKKHNPKGL